jgi:hypothetical protein
MEVRFEASMCDFSYSTPLGLADDIPMLRGLSPTAIQFEPLSGFDHPMTSINRIVCSQKYLLAF